MPHGKANGGQPARRRQLHVRALHVRAATAGNLGHKLLHDAVQAVRHRHVQRGKPPLILRR